MDRTHIDDTNEKLSYIPVDEIQPNRFQPRKSFAEQELEQLADSIDMHGLLQPIAVREIDDGEPGIKYEIVAGERRWRAHKFLDKKRIKAIIKQDVNDERSMEAALIENLQRENLNPMEEAESIVSLQKSLKLTQEQVAQRLGKTRGYISQIVRLVKLPSDVQETIRDNQLERYHGIILAAAPRELQSELAAKAVKGKWNTETLRKRVAAIKEDDLETEKKPKVRKVNARSANLVLVEAPSADALKELVEELSKDEDLHLWQGRTDIKAALAEEKEKKSKKTEAEEPVTTED